MEIKICVFKIQYYLLNKQNITYKVKYLYLIWVVKGIYFIQSKGEMGNVFLISQENIEQNIHSS